MSGPPLWVFVVALAAGLPIAQAVRSVSERDAIAAVEVGASGVGSPRRPKRPPTHGASSKRRGLRQRRRVAPGLSEVRLPEEVVWHTLGYVPRPLWVAASVGAGAATLWQDVGARGRQQRKLSGGGAIVDVQFFPSGDRVFTVGADGSCAVWDVWSGKHLLALWGGHIETASLFEARIFPDGARVATLGSDLRVVIWSASSGEVLQRLDMEGVCAQHQTLLVTGSNTVVTGISYTWEDPALAWNATDGKVQHQWRHLADRLSHVAISPCGKRVLTAGSSTIFVWNIHTGLRELNLAKPEAWFLGGAISFGTTSVVGAVGARILIWSAVTGELSRTLAMESDVLAVALLPHGDRLVALTRGGGVVWNFASGERLRTLAHEGGEPQRVVVSEGGEVVAACGCERSSWGREHVVFWTSAWNAGTGRTVYSADELKREKSLRICSVAVPSSGSVVDWLMK